MTRPDGGRGAPGAVHRRRAPDGASGDTADSGYRRSTSARLADFAGQPMTVHADHAGRRRRRAAPARQGAAARGRLVRALQGRGRRWPASTRCCAPAPWCRSTASAACTPASISCGACATALPPTAHKMNFVLVRNAVGPAPPGGGRPAGRHRLTDDTSNCCSISSSACATAFTASTAAR